MKYKNPFIAFGQFYRELTHVRKFREATLRPKSAQEQKLLEIIRLNQNTEFGKKHGFSTIQSIADYQQLVPPCVYEDLEPYITKQMNGIYNQISSEKPIMYATTSGTTGKPKFIPITPAHLKDYSHAFQIHNWGLTYDYPDTACAPNGKYLIFNSNDQEGFTPDGTPYGAVSGLLRRRQSAFVQRYIALPPSVARIKEVEKKYYTILRLALTQKIVVIASCNPSTLLLMADQMQEHAEELIKDIFDGTMRREMVSSDPELAAELDNYLVQDRDAGRQLAAVLDKEGTLLPCKAWPELKIITVWKGGPMPFYLDRLPEKFGISNFRDFGYMASEGRGTIPLADEGAGGVAALTSHFFEFVPEDEMQKSNKTFLTLDQLELGKRYFIYFTTAAGLYRYNINDLMEVVDFGNQTPILKFVQKGAGVSSITGEKLTEEQVTIALAFAQRQLQLGNVGHFILSVQLGNPPFYTGFVEPSGEMSDSVLTAMASIIDQSLQSQNIEYKDKRQSMRLGGIVLNRVQPGTFRRLRQQRVSDGAPEAQVKFPFLTNNSNFKDTIATLQAMEQAV
ncbi:MAG: GH3 auxin-responsive promoter family protein [Candidatus Obscuribacterales bacterium]|nr:GH3 auxin-responsive promoter family protein [Candidatus Obscuribacterales bacterium]